MTENWAQARDDLDRLLQRSRAAAETLQAAQSRPISGRSDDGAVEAVAAGQRLVSLTLTPAGDRLGHDELVTGLVTAARSALAGSRDAVRDAAATIRTI